MLNSAEHEILNANEYKISRNSAFSSSDKPIMLLFLLINVEMPTILTFMSRKNFMLSSAQLSIFVFYNLGARLFREILPQANRILTNFTFSQLPDLSVSHIQTLRR